MLVKLLKPGDHLLLVLVQHGVVDGYGDLVGERGEQTLVRGPEAFVLVGDADHADHVLAHSERHPEKGPHAGMARWLAYALRVVFDVVGDVRAVFDDDHAEDARAHRHRLEPLIEPWIWRRKSLYRDDIH